MAGTEPIIVVGLDGSEGSRTALRWAAGQARSTGAVLRAVASWRWPNYVTRIPPGADPAADAAQTLHDMVAELHAEHPTLTVTEHVVQGPAGPSLLTQAAGAALLVVGAHGRAAFPGMLIGSVAEYCVRHGPCPVVVVRTLAEWQRPARRSSLAHDRVRFVADGHRQRVGHEAGRPRVGVQPLGQLDVGRIGDGHQRVQRDLGEHSAADVVLAEHPRRVVDVAGHHDPVQRGVMQVPEHVALRRRGDEQLLRVPARRIAAELRGGRAGDRRRVLGAHLVLALVGAVVRRARTGVTGPLDGHRVPVLGGHDVTLRSGCGPRPDRGHRAGGRGRNVVLMPASAPPLGSRPGSGPRRGPAAWIGAFTGFYPATAHDLTDLDPVARFLYAARSVILVISAQAAVIAGLLAATDRRFEIVPFLLALVGFVVLHGISNLSNDYFGYRRGHDTEDSPRRRYTLHPVASGAFTMRFLATGLAVLAAVAAAIGGYFIVLRGWGAVVLTVVGALLLWAYDAAPRALKELGLGEIASFLVWGPLMIGGGYYVITGHWSGDALLASVPYGLGVMSILVGKHIDQRGFDISQSQHTLPVLLGEAGARRANQATLVLMYLITALAVAVGALSPFLALVLLAAPRALRALRVMSAPAPAAPPQGYVGWPLWYHRVCLVHNRAFGWLFILGAAVGAIWPAASIGH